MLNMEHVVALELFVLTSVGSERYPDWPVQEHIQPGELFCREKWGGSC